MKKQVRILPFLQASTSTRDTTTLLKAGNRSGGPCHDLIFLIIFSFFDKHNKSGGKVSGFSEESWRLGCFCCFLRWIGAGNDNFLYLLCFWLIWTRTSEQTHKRIKSQHNLIWSPIGRQWSTRLHKHLRRALTPHRARLLPHCLQLPSEYSGSPLPWPGESSHEYRGLDIRHIADNGGETK